MRTSYFLVDLIGLICCGSFQETTAAVIGDLSEAVVWTGTAAYFAIHYGAGTGVVGSWWRPFLTDTIGLCEWYFQSIRTENTREEGWNDISLRTNRRFRKSGPNNDAAGFVPESLRRPFQFENDERFVRKRRRLQFGTVKSSRFCKVDNSIDINQGTH